MDEAKASGQELAIRSQKSANSSLRDEIGSSNGSGPLSILEKPSWAALLGEQPNQLAVIDNRTVITGSFNWSPSAAHQNDEVLLVIHSPLVAAHFTREVDRLRKEAELGITEWLMRKAPGNRRRCGRGRSGVESECGRDSEEFRWLEWLWEWLREVQQGRKSQINNEQRVQLGS